MTNQKRQMSKRSMLALTRPGKTRIRWKTRTCPVHMGCTRSHACLRPSQQGTPRTLQSNHLRRNQAHSRCTCSHESSRPLRIQGRTQGTRYPKPREKTAREKGMLNLKQETLNKAWTQDNCFLTKEEKIKLPLARPRGHDSQVESVRST